MGSSDTAWSYREARYAQVIVGVDPDPANNPRTIAWSKEYWRRLHPHSAGGAYVNMMMDEGQERVQAAYRDNYPRRSIAPGELFMMGDNRDNSNDSRFWGTVAMDLVKGRAMFIYWSWDGERHWPRWTRLLRVIH